MFLLLHTCYFKQILNKSQRLEITFSKDYPEDPMSSVNFSFPEETNQYDPSPKTSFTRDDIDLAKNTLKFLLRHDLLSLGDNQMDALKSALSCLLNAATRA